ncbi:glycosyltransferase family 2 protein [Niveispirillum sp.]|uniref:glycosyltransferase family 2 protein n=1 Tax=Niveispirillum sp. TaxID=1917217 RepID=UPI001B52471F|nr:glycosyltransferase family 2 protein [Niveispirillum sp.]MBP7339405.1 glycosyltransferase family 2 protein [Niveispirillum sp.]
MSLSVVIPLYNKAEYIEETLASLGRQTRLPDEVIVVDDASTDGSAERAGVALSRLRAIGVRRVELLRQSDNAGPSTARNRGLERATGRVLAFLDADDCWRADCGARILDSMRDHALDLLVLGYDSLPSGERFPSADLLRRETIAAGGDLHLLPRLTTTAGDPSFFMGRASNVAVRRGVIGHERFVDGRHVNENIDFWYRIAKRIGRRNAGVDRPVAGLLAVPMIQYRILPDSLSHRRFSDWRHLQIPPSLERFRYSDDADDRRLCHLLGRRWLDFAMTSLSDPSACAAFCAAHGALLTHYGIGLPKMREVA